MPHRDLGAPGLYSACLIVAAVLALILYPVLMLVEDMTFCKGFAPEHAGGEFKSSKEEDKDE